MAGLRVLKVSEQKFSVVWSFMKDLSAPKTLGADRLAVFIKEYGK